LQFKIIHGLINGLEIETIKDLVRSKDDEFHSALNDLRLQSYIEKKGVSIFSYYEATDHGILAWKTYYEAFAESDVGHFIEEVKNHPKEVKQSADKKHVRNSR